MSKTVVELMRNKKKKAGEKGGMNCIKFIIQLRQYMLTTMLREKCNQPQVNNFKYVLR